MSLVNTPSKKVRDKSSGDVILEIDGISKSFGEVQALDDVSFDIREGEVLAVLGENGAGKSTLMKILAGLYKSDSGVLKGSLLSNSSISGFQSPKHSIESGIGMVYQHFQLFEPFTIADNILMGEEKRSGIGLWLDYKQVIKHITELGNKYGLPIDPARKVETLSVGERQRVEILKLLYRDANLLILDEPTAVLTPTEIDSLFAILRDLRSAGKSIIFISHKLRETLKVADRVVIMRKGKVASLIDLQNEEVDEEKLSQLVVGTDFGSLDRSSEVTAPVSDDPVLSVKNVYTNRTETGVSLENITFDVYPGEILGIVGVQRNGQVELVNSIIGLTPVSYGEITYFDDQGISYPLDRMGTHKIVELGIGHIPEDRTKDGVIEDFNVEQNIQLGFHSTQSLAERYLEGENWDQTKKSGGARIISPFIKLIMGSPLMKNVALTLIEKYNVVTPSEKTKVGNLSGGNQQKLLVARETAKRPKLLILNQPTRGVDVGVMNQIHETLFSLRKGGSSLILISSDLDEIFNLSDRVLVMFKGRIVHESYAKEVDYTHLSKLMLTGES